MKLIMSDSLKLIGVALLSITLVFAASATPQSKEKKSGNTSKGNSGKQLPTVTDVGSVDPTVPNKPTVSKKPSSKKSTVSTNSSVSKKTSISRKTTISKKPNGSRGGIGTHQSCVESCNTRHKDDAEICRGRTGPDRASCQQSINEQHRLCIKSCK